MNQEPTTLPAPATTASSCARARQTTAMRLGWCLLLLTSSAWWMTSACGPMTPTEQNTEQIVTPFEPPIDTAKPPVDSGPTDNQKADLSEQSSPQESVVTPDTQPGDETAAEEPPIDEPPPPPGTWPVSAGGSGADHGKHIAIDSKGNIYITGNFEETAQFGALTLTSSGGSDVFVAKLDNTGKFLWAVSGGSKVYDNAAGIAVDAQGNAYITGKIDGDATFGATTIKSIGFTDIFVARVNANGSWGWAHAIGDINQDTGEGIAVAPNGDVLITGIFRGNAKFGAQTLVAGPNDNVFVARLDPTGKWKWALGRDDIQSAAPAFAIAVDAEGHAYVTGYYVGNAKFGSTTLKPTGNFDTYIARVNNTGTWAWATPGGGEGPDSGRGIAVNKDGVLVVMGRFEGKLKLGATELQSLGQKDTFVTRLDTAGSFMWAKSFGSKSFDFSRSIAIDQTGHTYVSATFQQTLTIAGKSYQAGEKDNVAIVKFDKDGNTIWANVAGGKEFEAGFGIAVTPGGTPYVTGYYQDSSTFDGATLKSTGFDDIFIWRVKAP